MPGLTFSNELISRDEGTHTVSLAILPGEFAADKTRTSPVSYVTFMKNISEF